MNSDRSAQTICDVSVPACIEDLREILLELAIRVL